MWQCAIQMPGLVTSRRMSTVSPVRTSTVSLQTRFGSSTAVPAERPGSGRRRGRGRGGASGGRSPSRSRGGSSPGRRPGSASRSRCSRRRSTRSMIIQRMFAGVVIRLTSTMSSSHSMPPAACVRVAAGRGARGACSCPPRRRAPAGTSFMPHCGQRSGVVAHDLGVHRAGVSARRRRRDELHPALGAAVGRVADDLGVHRAGVDDRALALRGAMSISATKAIVLSGSAPRTSASRARSAVSSGSRPQLLELLAI